ncbi:Tat pathway signal sequence domain protein [Amycolatopsis sp. NPDC059657]|uniref:Tat pathway signal sequence domain protein n=1 Tax=Amycolatopsis sp. NPDC059657 TaxID=3346899 RepID=UPI00366AC186
MTEFDRRKALALGAGTLSALALGMTPAQAATWQLRWSPTPAKDGLNAFEGLEDDRSHSHTSVKHIYTEGDHWRFDMHTQDRDGSDRQRNESKGMRGDGKTYPILKDTTWRIQYQAFWPSELTATTSFTHIAQMKVSDVGPPLFTLTPRAKGPKGGVLTIDGDSGGSRDLADYAPLQNKWIDVMYEFKASHSGYLRVVIQNGSTVVHDSKKNADLWRDKNYLKPKWGVYRSIKSSGLKNCYQLIRNYKGYQLV